MGDVVIILLKIGFAALLAWGAFLCFARTDRRSGRDRRGAGRGGRRPNDYYAKAPAGGAVAAAEVIAPEAEQKVA